MIQSVSASHDGCSATLIGLSRSKLIEKMMLWCLFAADNHNPVRSVIQSSTRSCRDALVMTKRRTVVRQSVFAIDDLVGRGVACRCNNTVHTRRPAATTAC